REEFFGRPRLTAFNAIKEARDVGHWRSTDKTRFASRVPARAVVSLLEPDRPGRNRAPAGTTTPAFWHAVEWYLPPRCGQHPAGVVTHYDAPGRGTQVPLSCAGRTFAGFRKRAACAAAPAR